MPSAPTRSRPGFASVASSAWWRARRTPISCGRSGRALVGVPITDTVPAPAAVVVDDIDFAAVRADTPKGPVPTVVGEPITVFIAVQITDTALPLLPPKLGM